jgi:hypothetical protein
MPSLGCTKQSLGINAHLGRAFPGAPMAAEMAAFPDSDPILSAHSQRRHARRSGSRPPDGILEVPDRTGADFRTLGVRAGIL